MAPSAYAGLLMLIQVPFWSYPLGLWIGSYVLFFLVSHAIGLLYCGCFLFIAAEKTQVSEVLGTKVELKTHYSLPNLTLRSS